MQEGVGGNFWKARSFVARLRLPLSLPTFSDDDTRAALLKNTMTVCFLMLINRRAGTRCRCRRGRRRRRPHPRRHRRRRVRAATVRF